MIIIKRLIVLMCSAILLVGCGENEQEKELRKAKEQLEEAKKDSQRLEEVSKQIDETSELIEEVQEEMGIEDEPDALDETELKDMLEYKALTEGDVITDLSIKGDEISVKVDIANDSLIDDKKLLAEVIYSSAGDELLQMEGWEVLTIEFTDVGIVSMNRNESESNEYGEYFPTEDILKQLE